MSNPLGKGITLSLTLDKMGNRHFASDKVGHTISTELRRNPSVSIDLPQERFVRESR
jgi:hypothetical protein